MRLLIDNLDGQGAMDYSAFVSSAVPLTIRRSLNAISHCEGSVCLAGMALVVPVRRARVFVTTDAGDELFTGYLVSEAAPVFDEIASRSDAEVYGFVAKSDEWLLDLSPLGNSGPVLGSNVSAVAKELARIGELDLSGVTLANGVGVFHPLAGESVTANLGNAAASGYGATRVLGGALNLRQAAGTVHTLTTGDARSVMTQLEFLQRRELVNDVTIAGEMEGTTYVTEVFTGDGATQLFPLSERPFAATKAVLLEDFFAGSVLNPSVWKASDPGSVVSLSSAGLTLIGGNGFDGQTVVQMQNGVEMAGTIAAEARGVLLNAASDGILCGFYSGTVEQANCVAGVRVRQSSGQTLAIAFVNGAEVGTVMSVTTGHAYQFLVRLHCNETVRVMQNYYSRGGGAVSSFGGGLMNAAMRVVVVARDLGLASSTSATTLYDGGVTSSPAVATFAAVNATQVFGSIGEVVVQTTGSTWVVSRFADGSERTRLIGAVGEGLDASLTSAGTSAGVLTFYAGRIPGAGEQVLVKYRAAGRAVGRRQDAASVLAEGSTGLPGVSRWVGSVKQPVARCSVDCESAAAALVAVSVDREAAIEGRCDGVNLQTLTFPAETDVWPGDLLRVDDGYGQSSVMVRTAVLRDGSANPERIEYAMEFANDWAKEVAIETKAGVPKDAVLPSTANGAAIASLPELKVVSVSGSAIQVDAGMDAAAGGGFEVRRRDAGFGGSSGDLVLRSPVRSFSIPRQAQREMYFVRMYDGSGAYSRYASAVMVTVPLG